MYSPMYIFYLLPFHFHLQHNMLITIISRHYIVGIYLNWPFNNKIIKGSQKFIMRAHITDLQSGREYTVRRMEEVIKQA